MYQLFPFLNHGLSPFHFLLILAAFVLAATLAAHIMAWLILRIISRLHHLEPQAAPASTPALHHTQSRHGLGNIKRLVTVPKIVLAVVMLLIGTGTAYASASTYEVVTRRDLPVFTVVKPVRITKSAAFNTSLIAAFHTNYQSGEFGTPASITFPETEKVIDITQASRQNRRWEANRTLAQTFLAAPPRQKMFGRAIIYLRSNTPTTSHLGSVTQGDQIDIVTTRGWHLRYTVTQTSRDPATLVLSDSSSEIVVILVNNTTSAITAFDATLSSVGDRS